MGTIPAVPVFPAGLPAQGTAMQNLCTALTWCLSGRPLARLQQVTAQTIGTLNATAITWDTKITDRDGGWSSGANSRYTAQTPGIYLLSANVDWASNNTGFRGMYFQATTGSNNPAGPGVVTQFGWSSLGADGFTTGTCGKSLSPYMYVNDYVQVIALQNSGGNLATLTTGAAGMFFNVEHMSG